MVSHLPLNHIHLQFLVVLIILFGQCTPKCSGGFDVYFILDKSSSVSVDNFQVQTVGFVQGLISEIKGPTTRVSIITFSTSARIVLKLTGDEDGIQQGIKNLKKIQPEGDTKMEKGLDEAKGQIRAFGERKASVIVVLTDGELLRPSDYKSFERTDKLKKEMGVTIFAVGVGRYRREQLERLASEPTTNHVHTAERFDEEALHKIAIKIIDTACVEVTDVKPNSVCVGKSYDVVLYGKGFTKAVDHSKIRCNFKINNTIDHVIPPSMISDTQLKCRAPILKTIKSFVVLQVSLHHEKFITSDIRVVASTCEEDTTDVLTVLLLLLLFVLLPLSCVWWFYFLLPCVKQKPTRPPPPPVTPPTTPTETDQEPPAAPISSSSSGKWPTVDASYYGGGGVGGITPVKVKWGEKGATEGGARLTATPDANIIENNDDGDDVFMMQTSDGGASRRSPGCSQRMMGFVAGVGGLMAAAYRRVADLRPRKGGQSHLFTNSSERNNLHNG